MDVVAGLDHLPASREPAFVVVGVFDGLHRGHAYLLRNLVAEARRRSARPVVITFDHHPDEILTGTAPPLLCDPAERLARLEAAGVATTVVQHFDRRLRETPYDAFVGMITERVPLAGFLMTPDAAFGYQRGGTPETLAALGRSAGFEVCVVPPFIVDGRAVRSSEVREAIAAGDLDRATLLLGRAHAVAGEPAGGDAGELRFAMPVALPPSGRYTVHAGVPWHPGWHGRRATVEVGEGTVRLEGRRPAGSRRIAFLDGHVGVRG